MARRKTDGFRVFKPKWKRGDAHGQSSRYHVAFTFRRRRCQLVAFTDYAASVTYGRRIREFADRSQVGDRP